MSQSTAKKSNMKMDLAGMGSWAANAPTFPAGADLLSDLSELSGMTRNATTFPDTRPANGSSASLEAYRNAPAPPNHGPLPIAVRGGHGRIMTGVIVYEFMQMWTRLQAHTLDC